MIVYAKSLQEEASIVNFDWCLNEDSALPAAVSQAQVSVSMFRRPMHEAL